MKSSSPTSPLIKKRAFEAVEHSVTGFNDVLLPHRLDMLEKHRINIKKFVQAGDYKGASKEQAIISILVENLSRDLIDIEALRNQVRDQDLAKFDSAVMASRARAMEALRDFMNNKPERTPLGKWVPEKEEEDEEDDSGYTAGSTRTLKDLPQTHDEKSCLLTPDEESYLEDLEKLQRDIEDLNESFINLHAIVKEQDELIDGISDNVAVARDNISTGEKNLVKALEYKSVVYPVMGATIGTLLGGPVGLLIGLKSAGCLAIGGGIAGFIGGKLLKRKVVATTQMEKKME